MLTKALVILLLFGFVPLVAQTRKPSGHYECPMHPDVTSKKPGKCPKCQMRLRFTPDKPKEEAPAQPAASTAMRIPDVTVQDQNGKSLNFYTELVKGKVVAINFIFTTCTTICPPLTATFRRVQQELAAQNSSVQLISARCARSSSSTPRTPGIPDSWRTSPAPAQSRVPPPICSRPP